MKTKPALKTCNTCGKTWTDDYPDLPNSLLWCGDCVRNTEGEPNPAPRYVTDAERANLGCSTPGECPCEILSRMDATIAALLDGIEKAECDRWNCNCMAPLEALAAQVRGSK